MNYISNYKENAIDKIVPYLINFPSIVSLVENSSERYQQIEDLLWRVANNFKVDDARGVFLDVIAHNEVLDLIYTDRAEDAFTYGTEKPLTQSYGTGHYYSQASYISGIKKDISEDKLIRAIKAKIIQNNTQCTVEDLIEALMHLYNATKINIYESDLSVSVGLEGKSLEISSSNNYELIKKMLPASVKLSNIFVNPYTFNLFKYNEESSYGDTELPVHIIKTIQDYIPKTNAIKLQSLYNEYVKTNKIGFSDGEYCCISFSPVENSGSIFGLKNGSNILSLNIENNKFVVNLNGTKTSTNVTSTVNSNYTAIIYNNSNAIKVWVLKSDTSPIRCVLDNDTSFIISKIKNTTPDVNISGYSNIDSNIYINSLDSSSNFGNCIYYNIMFGSISGIKNICSEYYNTSFGEKQILFNCLENKNHLQINTTNELKKDITILQSYLNYKKNYSNGKYLYLDGKSGINYTLSNSITSNLNSVNISFDICSPIKIQTGFILYSFIGDSSHKSYVRINSDKKLEISFYTLSNGTYTRKEFEIDEVLENSKYYKINIQIEEGVINVSLNDNTYISSYTGSINDIQKTFRIGYDDNTTNFYKGFISSLYMNINYNNNEHVLNVPFKYRLKDLSSTYSFENFGARLITTPQLLNDTTQLDLYGNKLIGNR